MAEIVLSRLQNSSQLKLGGVILSWSPTGDQLQYTTKKSADKKFFVIDLDDDVSSHHFTKSELSLNETYLFQVVAGSSKSNTLEVAFLSDKPDKPLISSVVSMDNSLRFKMQMGSSNGAIVSTIKFLLSNSVDIFSVERPINGSNEYTLDSDDGISNYQVYEIAACVLSNRGVSELSDGVVSEASDYPNKVENLSRTEGDKSVVINWNKPSDFADWSDNFRKIHIWYKAMSETEFIRLSFNDINKLSHTIEGLSNGVFYHFKISYENEYGVDVHTAWSDLSSFSSYGKPAAPTLSEIKNITETSMVAKYTKTQDLNGMDSEGHWVKVYLPNGTFVNQYYGGHESNEVLLSGLTQGQDYVVNVIAEGKKITQHPSYVKFHSDASNSMTKRPFGQPTSVKNLKATAYAIGQEDLIDTNIGGKLLIQHTAPLDNGGFEIYRYKVTLSNEGNDITREYSGNSVFVDGLVNGKAYDISVKAYTLNLNDSNSLIEGEVAYHDALSINPSNWSNPANIPVKIPSAVQNASAVELDRKLKITWDEPLDNGGTPILKYKVDVQEKRVNGNPQSWSSGMLSSDVKEWTSPLELTNGIEYIVKISAYNQIYNRGSMIQLNKSPFGSQLIDNISLSGKTIAFRVNTNGRPVQEYHVVAIDDDRLNDSETYYLKTQVTNTEQVNNVEFTKTFSSLSASISKYLIIVENTNGDTIYKTTFTV